MLPFLFNFDEPRIFGFPRFYWLQFAFIAVGVVCTTVVYQMTKRRR
ncbi:cellobiose-specific phosphotransferase system component IIC [Streptosporangium brasiliense]|uniref:Cellobiose-specific phosphotransferase system component IIC n=1 Tax=Streptosporangium brasiliense TaxID=47480 RepID=A0ABT9RP03_9ACTN|nr:cellobiose-specific phosphotransferase system component IIC [Streptosporangium brasiliense]